MEAPKDKRTKAYKEWVKNHQKTSEGLGDTVEKITSFIKRYNYGRYYNV